MATILGTRKAQALPIHVFHAHSGYDTVSSFVEHGRKTT